MANEKLTQQTELTTPAADDLVYIVDVSDTTDGAAGSSRKIQVSNLMKEAPVQPSDLTGYATTTYVDTEVGNEESARITADANLQTNIDAVNTAVSSLTTDDVTEATNLYYTDARVQAHLESGNVDEINVNGEATITWETDYESLLVTHPNGFELRLGQDSVIYGKADSAITKGQAVMFAGAQGSHILLAPADMSAAGFAPELVIGIAGQNLAIGAFGYVLAFGLVPGLNTSSYSDGDLLYLDPSTAGALTTTKPTPPDHIILLAAVRYSHASVGTLQVRPTHQSDTDETPEGTTNLYHTTARVNAVIAAASVTDLSDVTSAGSGAIITAAERTQISTNQTNIGINAGGIANNASNITALDAQVQTNSTDIGTLNSDLTALDTRVGTAETDIAGLQTDLDALNLTDLNDTPATLGTAGQLLAVNSTATATEWVNPAAGGGDVTSVNGQTGVVVLDTDDITQGATNLYYPTADANKLAGIQAGAEVNVNADWNATSGDAQILNKPTLASVATSGAYADLSGAPTIPTALSDLTGDTGDVTEGTNLYYTDARVQTYLTSEKIRANYPSLFYTGNTLITSQQEQTLMIGKASATMQFAVSAGLSKDCEILVMQDDEGSIIITGAQGVTILTSSSFKPETAGQYAIIGLKQIGLTNTYVVTGERKPV